MAPKWAPNHLSQKTSGAYTSESNKTTANKEAHVKGQMYTPSAQLTPRALGAEGADENANYPVFAWKEFNYLLYKAAA